MMRLRVGRVLSLWLALLVGVTGLVGVATAQAQSVDPQLREEVLLALDGLDDELVSFKQQAHDDLSAPVAVSKACVTLALEYVKEQKAIGVATAASGAKGAMEVALFILQGFDVSSSVFSAKCLKIQDPETGAAGGFIGTGGRQTARLDLAALEDSKADLEKLYRDDVVTAIEEGIASDLITGEDLIDELRTELNAIFLKIFELDSLIIDGQILQNACKERLLEAIAYVEKVTAGVSGAEANFRKASSAIKRCLRDLSRLLRIEKSIFLKVKDIILEKVLLIKKLFFLIPLPVPGLPPPPIGLQRQGGVHFAVPDAVQLWVQVFSLDGRVIYDSGPVAGSQLSWSKLGVANGVFFYVIRAVGADHRTSQRVGKFVILR